MQSQPDSKYSELTDSTIQPLLAHFDAQEAAMLALKSLLYDIGLHPDDSSHVRQLHVRMNAATDLLQRLDHDLKLLIQQVSAAAGDSKNMVTIGELIRLFDSRDSVTAEALRSGRRRLLNLRWQIGRVAASSGWVVAEERRRRHAVFQHASGLADSDRYDSSGQAALSPDSLRFGARS